MGAKDKSSLLTQVVQLVNMANQLLIAVSEYTGETVSIVSPKEKPAVQKHRSEPKEIVTTEEASEILGRSKSAIYALVHRGELSRHGSGRRAYFKRSELVDFMLRNKKSSSQELNDQAAKILNGEE